MLKDTMQWLVTNGFDTFYVVDKENNGTVYGKIAHKLLFSDTVNKEDLRNNKAGNTAFCYELVCGDMVLRCAQKDKETCLKFMPENRDNFVIVIIELA